MELKRQALMPDANKAGRDAGDNFRLPTSRGVLSAAEIEALLRPDIPENAFEEPKTVSARPVFDFETGSEGSLLAGDAAILAAEMTVALRKHCAIDAVLGLESAEYAPLSQIVAAHERPSVLILFRDRSGLQNAGLTLDAVLASAFVAVACGGQADAASARPLSALDGRILEHMLAPLAQAIDPSFQIVCVETDRSAAFAMLPPGKAMLADMSCGLGNVRGRLIFARVQDTPALTRDDPHALPMPVSAVVTARIARINVPISHLSNLKPGAVLRLGLPADQPVELLSGGRDGQLIAEGDVGRKGDRIAVRVSKCTPALKG